ncbi:toxin Cry1Ac domain D-VI-related protein [Listeria rustica]|uniref:Pesticidal crystal protein Cry1Aa domain-containing protein n=1 Tax=Listeria rustica TaxID=2713503 RepID=A0A7W1T658_9LIST|nr:toxin Cry1Ac domain D-VI-related protein [Listeria rustica]MBA3926216.1 hypothetical protein [Listeria rustica]
MKKKLIVVVLIFSMLIEPTSFFVHAAEESPNEIHQTLLGSTATDAETAVNDLFIDNDPTKELKPTTDQVAIDAAQAQVNAVTDATLKTALQKKLQRAKDLLEVDAAKASFHDFIVTATGWSALVDESQRLRFYYTFYLNDTYCSSFDGGTMYYGGQKVVGNYRNIYQGLNLKDGDILKATVKVNDKFYTIQTITVDRTYDNAKAAADALFIDNNPTNEIKTATDQKAIDAAKVLVDKVTDPTKNAELNAEIAKAQAQFDMRTEKEAPTADTVMQTFDKNAVIPDASTFLTNVHDNADDILPNNITISYVTPPTTASIGVRTTQISIKDRAGNTTMKNVNYIVQDETVAIKDNYVIHSDDIQLQTSELANKTPSQIAELLRQKAGVQGWDSATAQDITNQITSDSPTPQTPGSFEITYKLGTASITSNVVITDNTTFKFTATPADLNFETAEINSSETTIARADTDWNIGVTDARNNGTDWSITATVNGPFTAADMSSKTLADALTFTTATTETRIRDNEAFTIYNGKSGAQTDTNVHWAKDQGIRMKVNTTGVKAETDYATSITWTLNDTP